MSPEELTKRIEELEAKATTVVEKLTAGAISPEDQKSLSGELAELKDSMKPLLEAREGQLRDEERKAMETEVKSLRDSIEDLRKPQDFSFGGSDSSDADSEGKALYTSDSDHSFYADAKALLSGNGLSQTALERYGKAIGEKAMTEGTGSAGGLLVPDQISSDLLQLRQTAATLRALMSQVQVSSDTLRIASVTGGLTAGWVAELATKPSADLAFGEISTNVFTAAGLAVASNQLLQDAVHSVDSLVNQDLARRLANLEEIAFINGTGTGQPQGILNTSGIQTSTYTAATPDPLGLLDAILNAITLVHTNYFGAPDAIVMHPRTWGFLVKAREAASSANYIIGPPAGAANRRPGDPLPGYGATDLPRGELFGTPVYTSANIPITLGAGTNESRVIVGNFKEALILDRQGITLDNSSHVYFTSNQTVFRAEERVGFTAARYPKAFCTVGGTGLAGV